MRIWILSTELASEYAGGIARYLDNFGRILGAAGHEVMVISMAKQTFDQEWAPGFRVIGVEARYKHLQEFNPTDRPDQHEAYPYNVFDYWPALSFQMAEEVLTLMKQYPPPDIIESQEVMALPYYLIQRKLIEHPTPLEQIPILVHLHTPYYEVLRLNQEPRYRFPAYWLGQMEKFCIRAADALLCPSKFLARSLEKGLQLSSDITILPYPVPPDNSFSPRPDAPPGHIVYVGRLEVRKGVLPLLKACQCLWSAGHDFRLTLVGGEVSYAPFDTTVGAYMEQRYGQWLKSGHLNWVGQVDHKTVLEHMNQAWAVVIPSLFENFPNTCIEAMATGQVVLGSSAGGQAEMIAADGVNGFIFDWQVPGDFEKKLIQIINLDPEERQNIARRAQTRIRALCDPETVLNQRLEHYQEVIATHAPRRFFPQVSYRVTGSGAGKEGELSGPLAAAEEEEPGLLSVIIPYYNLGDYLEETLASVLASTYSPFEVLIINDGSTDAKSLEVLRTIEERRISHVRVLHTANQGLALTRNFGAQNARGEFIVSVDSDDQVEPDFFRQAIEILKRYPNVTFAYSWVRCFGVYSGLWPTWNTEFPYLLGHNMLNPMTVVRRSAFLEAGNKKDFVYGLEDYEGWIALVKANGLGVSIPAPLVRYRVRPDSMFQRLNRNQKLYLYDLLTQYHPELYRQWGVELFNLQCANGPGYIWEHPAVPTMEVTAPDELPPSLDYQIACQVLSRIRNLRLVSYILQYATIRQILKKTLLKIQRLL